MSRSLPVWPLPPWSLPAWSLPAWPGRWRPRRSSTLIVLLGTLGLATLARIALLVHDAATTPEAPASAVVADHPGAGADPTAAAPLPEPAAGPGDVVTTSPEAPEEPETPAGAAPRLDVRRLSAAEIEVLHRLAERRVALERRARDLDRHAVLLETAEAKLAAQIERLTRLRAEIEAMVKAHDAKEEAKIASLVKIYETMKPKAAAEIFDRLEMAVLLEVIERMREAKSADVLARMDPAKAKLVTAALARRTRLLGRGAGS